MSQQTPEFFHNAEHTAYLIWFSANYISLQCVWSYVRLIKIENRRLVDHDLPYNIFTLRVNKAVCIPCPAKTLILFEVELFTCFKTFDYDPESWSCNQRFRNRHPSLYSIQRYGIKCNYRRFFHNLMKDTHFLYIVVL